MIYLDDNINNTLPSIIEGLYLDERFSDRFSNSDILVCPEYTKYITGKTIIINRSNYSKDLCSKLIENGNEVISRIHLDYLDELGIEFDPYIIQPYFNVMWNGMYIDVSGLDIIGITNKLEGNIIFNPNELNSRCTDYIYFPKLLNLSEDIVKDSSSNLTAFGWLMHQIGINIDKETGFQDMDAIKMMKRLF